MDDGHLRLEARTIPTPRTVSARAAAHLEAMARTPSPTRYHADGRSGWEAMKQVGDQIMAARFLPAREGFRGTVEAQDWNGVTVHKITPERVGHTDRAVLYLHGGCYLFGAGETGAHMALLQAADCGLKTFSVDYRMPPEDPFPAALDDATTAWRELAARYGPKKVAVMGLSAGGGLAAALILRLRDQGEDLPGCAVLFTPEADLTEAGDSFRAGAFPVDFTSISRLYADGRDLTDPYLSPLFADFTAGFPPTLITTGTRDFFLSSCALLHRKMRKAGVEAEIHVWEAMPHGGFDGQSEEDKDLRVEVTHFLERRLA